jgi:hypothetical protein
VAEPSALSEAPEQPEFVRECIGWGAFATVVVPTVLLVTGSTVKAAIIGGAAVAAMTAAIYLLIRMTRMPLAAVEDPAQPAGSGLPDAGAATWEAPPPDLPVYSADHWEMPPDVDRYEPAWEAPAGGPYLYAEHPWERHFPSFDPYERAPWEAGAGQYEPGPWDEPAPAVSPYTSSPWNGTRTGAEQSEPGPWEEPAPAVSPYTSGPWNGSRTGAGRHEPAPWDEPPTGAGAHEPPPWEPPRAAWMPYPNGDDGRPPWEARHGHQVAPGRQMSPLPNPAQPPPDAYPPDQRGRHRRGP